MAVTECDNLTILMSVCTQMNDNERDTVMPIILQGFTVTYTLADEIDERYLKRKNATENYFVI